MRLPRLVRVLAALAVALSAPAAATAATADPNQKTTVTDIQYRLSYSLEIPGNCAVLGFSQWDAEKLKGWEAYRVAITLGTPPRTDSFSVSPAPTYDDAFKYGGNVISPPAGTHWVLIGNGSYRAGGPPADPDCTDLLARSQALVAGNKVTTSFRRTAACVTKFDALTAAQQTAKKAKGKKAKAKAKAKKALAKAKKAFDKDCSR